MGTAQPRFSGHATLCLVRLSPLISGRDVCLCVWCECRCMMSARRLRVCLHVHTGPYVLPMRGSPWEWGALCLGGAGAQKWAPQAQAFRGWEQTQVRSRLRLSSPLLYPGSARSEGDPWPSSEYPRILTLAAPVLCPTPTMGSTASVFPWWNGTGFPLLDSFSLQQGGHGDPGPPGAPVSGRESTAWWGWDGHRSPPVSQACLCSSLSPDR